MLRIDGSTDQWWVIVRHPGDSWAMAAELFTFKHQAEKRIDELRFCTGVEFAMRPMLVSFAAKACSDDEANAYAEKQQAFLDRRQAEREAKGEPS